MRKKKVFSLEFRICQSVVDFWRQLKRRKFRNSLKRCWKLGKILHGFVCEGVVKYRGSVFGSSVALVADGYKVLFRPNYFASYSQLLHRSRENFRLLQLRTLTKMEGGGGAGYRVRRRNFSPAPPLPSFLPSFLSTFQLKFMFEMLFFALRHPYTQFWFSILLEKRKSNEEPKRNQFQNYNYWLRIVFLKISSTQYWYCLCRTL